MPMLWIHIKGLCNTSVLLWHPQDGITPLMLFLSFFFFFTFLVLRFNVCACVGGCVCVCTFLKFFQIHLHVSKDAKLHLQVPLHLCGCACESVHKPWEGRRLIIIFETLLIAGETEIQPWGEKVKGKADLGLLSNTQSLFVLLRFLYSTIFKPYHVTGIWKNEEQEFNTT